MPKGRDAARRPRGVGLGIGVVLVLALLVALGTWQIQRLSWKTALIAEIAARTRAPAVALPARIDHPQAFDYRHVIVEGHWRHAREMQLSHPSRQGRAGFHVITPLVRAAGPLVLVDRGWVPPERKAPATRRQGLVAGPVRVEGIARVPAPKGWLTPDNDPQSNLWYWFDLGAMGRYVGGQVLPVIVEAGPAPNPGGYPVGGQTRVALRNPHLGYALTWYGLAGALVAVYVFFVRGRRARPHPEDRSA